MKILGAIALSVVLAAPAGSRGDVPLPPPPAGTMLRARSGTWLGAGVGVYSSFDGGVSSIHLALDLAFPGRTPPGWPVELEWHVPASVAMPRSSGTLMVTQVAYPGGPSFQVPAGSTRTEALVVEVVPTARLRLPVVSRFAVHADGGVGLVEVVGKKVEDQSGVGRTTTSKYTTAPVLRLGAGMSYDASERVRITFEPVLLSVQLGADWSAFNALVTVAYRM